MSFQTARFYFCAKTLYKTQKLSRRTRQAHADRARNDIFTFCRQRGSHHFFRSDQRLVQGEFRCRKRSLRFIRDLLLRFRSFANERDRRDLRLGIRLLVRNNIAYFRDCRRGFGFVFDTSANRGRAFNGSFRASSEGEHDLQCARQTKLLADDAFNLSAAAFARDAVCADQFSDDFGACSLFFIRNRNACRNVSAFGGGRLFRFGFGNFGFRQSE